MNDVKVVLRIRKGSQSESDRWERLTVSEVWLAVGVDGMYICDTMARRPDGHVNEAG